MTSPDQSPLGKASPYADRYDPTLLFPIARAAKRAELQIDGTLPFFGMDIWNAYELSWLNLRGKPQIAIANTASDLTPCNSHLGEVAQAVKNGIYAAGGIPLPEPSSMLLLGLGVIGVAVGRKLSSKRRED